MNWQPILIATLSCACRQLPAAPRVPAFADYEIVSKRNVFDATRQPYQKPVPRPPAPQPEPPPPAPKILTLAGVFIADSRALALFVGTDGTCTNVPVDGKIDKMSIAAVDSGSVTLKVGEQDLRVAVGEQLSDGGKGEWAVVGRAEQAPSVQAAAEEKKAASRADLLKQMMERRKRELEQ